MSRGSRLREIEDFPKKIKIFFFIIIFMLAFGTIGFKLLTNLSFSGSFLRTIETLAVMFKENSPLPERMLELFMAIVGVFLVWWVLWSMADMLLDGNLKKYLKSKLYKVKLSKMKKHTIIIGGGRIGEEIASIISKKKIPFLIIELDSNVVFSLRKKGYFVIEGDGSSELVLKEAKISSAKKIVMTLPKTETNILLTLTAKELNPSIEIYSRCEKQSLTSKLKKAGAKLVIIPEIVAADKIAEDLNLE